MQQNNRIGSKVTIYDGTAEIVAKWKIRLIQW